MPGFVVYRESDGQILRSGSCRASDIPLQARDGEISIQMKPPNQADIRYRVKRGELEEAPDLLEAHRRSQRRQLV